MASKQLNRYLGLRREPASGEPTAIDLFSGCGGLSIGLIKAGFRVCAAVENDAKARFTYGLNHGGVKQFGDIRKLNPKTLMKDLQLQVGQLGLLAGCPPCQGFSRLRTRNKRKSVSDPRNNLISDYLRFVRAFKPQTVMLENVPALLGDKRFERLCDSLRRLKYHFVAQVLDAGDYGVPQRRKRLILLGSRVHIPHLAAKSRRRTTVRKALAGMNHPSKTHDALHAIPEFRAKSVKALIRHIPRNGGSRSDLPAKYRLACHKRSDGYKDVYGRMEWDSLAPTITSGCINPSKGRFLHPVQNRAITLREAAILQGFPRRYKFEVSHGKEAIALMIGNALPPPFIAAHAKGLRDGILAKRR
jgi:DNA (cytosine-5)-methyltransferase 1